MTYIERFSVTGKRALVTGGSKGIGMIAAQVLAQGGAEIAVAGRDRDGLEAARRLVEAAGRSCYLIEADFRTVEGARHAGQAALDHFGTVDVLVNNAGIALINNLLDLTIEEWEATHAVNLRAPFIVAQMLAPAMIAQGSGKIINVSSQAGTVALEGHAAYSASKGGLNMLTQSMACEWGQYNIQTNTISPTVILTPMGEQVWGDPAKGEPMKAKIPLRRFGKPLEVADLILFLASSASDLICGENIHIDGGYTAI